ncbi:hypothetical protein DL764_009144 [Monosporascus ibericus]|uniref:Chitinase n=1 Tax=Monosporascus ibericus TaxID=155417 RepID=A0A4Q4SYN1_9PEZI|nr:hypothetical protein DL764_009144 [Monosporascus ibericus]
MYEMCAVRGWPPEKLVVGLVTSPDNGAGWVPFEVLGPNLSLLRRRFPGFGGVMGWEYFNGWPGGRERPWEWARHMTKLLRATGKGAEAADAERKNGATATTEVNTDTVDEVKLITPDNFQYYFSASDDGS